MFNFVLRNRHLFRGKLKKEVFDFNTSIAAFRDQCEAGAARFWRIPEGITIREATMAMDEIVAFIKKFL